MQAVAQWKSQIVNSSTTDWLLCQACAAKAIRYRSEGRTSSHPSTVGTKTNPNFAGSPSSPLTSESQTSANTTTKPAGTGCFIATACYVRYDAPEVLTLRRFRIQNIYKIRIWWPDCGLVLQDITFYYQVV